MPLKFEGYNPHVKQWVSVALLEPGDPPVSMSDNAPDGTRHIYHVQCAADDCSSTILRSRFGVDRDLGPYRVTDTIGLEPIATLRRGDAPYEMAVKTDRSPESRRLRFTHL